MKTELLGDYSLESGRQDSQHGEGKNTKSAGRDFADRR